MMALVSVLLPAPGRPGEPNGVSVTATRISESTNLARFIVATFNQGKKSGQRTAITIECVGKKFGSRFALTSHRIEAWPSQVAQARTFSATLITSVTPSTRSRMIRSTPAFSV